MRLASILSRLNASSSSFTSSLSSREAFEMSLTSRSSRRTSWSITSSSLSRWSSLLDEAQRADGGAQRGERVLDLVRDVGGELFVRVDPVVERRDHAAQRAREPPDLVRPGGQVGDADAAGRDLARRSGRARSRPRRRGRTAGWRWCEASTRVRPIETSDRDHEHLQHLLALVADQRVDLARRARDDRATPTMASPCADRRGDGEVGVARRVPPGADAGLAVERGRHEVGARSPRCRCRRSAVRRGERRPAMPSQTPFRKSVMIVRAVVDPEADGAAGPRNARPRGEGRRACPSRSKR